MTLTALAAPFAIGDCTFNTVDSNGVRLVGNIDSGWLNSPAVTMQVVQRQNDHGGDSGSSFLVPRVITISGLLEAPTEALLFTALSHLKRSISRNLTDFRVYHAGRILMARVRRSAETLVTEVNPRQVEWSAQVTAPDPRRYSDIIPLAPIGPDGQLRGIVHEGDIEAPFFASLTGMIKSPVLYYSTADSPPVSLSMDDTYTLAANRRLDFDFGERTVFEMTLDPATGLVLAVTDVSNRLNGRQWGLLQPGSGAFHLGSLGSTDPHWDGNCQMTITARSAWE